jgi:hypothetical protein
MRVLAFVLACALPVLGQTADAKKLEVIRKMSPEQREVLKRRLAELKKLPEVERERLKDNLAKLKSLAPEEARKVREKAVKLSTEEHKEYAELASGFFKWSQRMGYREGFPRGMFFHWLKSEKPSKVAEIRAMEPGPGSPRVDEFLKLYHEFRGVAISRTLEHVRKHRCAEVETAESLREASPREFWPRWQELTRECASRRAQPGPVPPRPLDAPKK